MKTKKIIWISILLMVLLVTPIKSGETYQYFMDGEIYSFNPRIDNWYDVEDWELEVCRKWGGTPSAYNVDNGPTYLSQTTITLQGEKSEKLPDETTMYEVAYYIEDAMNRSLEYAVGLYNPNTEEYKRIVGITSLSENEAASGYEAYYLSEEYTQVDLGYVLEDEDTLTIVSVPIVDNKGEYVPSSDYGYSDGNDPWVGRDW